MRAIDVKELKEYIISHDKINVLLENVGCHSGKEYSTEYRYALPNESNSSKVSIKKDTLSVRVFDSEADIRGDIITLFMELKGLTFIQALKQIHSVLGLPFTKMLPQDSNTKPKIDPLDVFKKVRKRNLSYNSTLNKIDENVLDRYLYLPHINFVREGILPNVQKEFGIRYDHKSKRILIPHRHWSTGELIGVVGRTTIECYDILDIPKYYPIKSYPKSLNIYGLFENYHHIQRRGEVWVFESEKSVLKCNSYGMPYGVAFCGLAGKMLSKEQVKILLSLNVDIIIATDKGIKEKVNKSICKQFNAMRNTYYINDKYGLLNDKDAPIDRGLKRFKYLLNNKIKVE